jgi:hypothetical protein
MFLHYRDKIWGFTPLSQPIHFGLLSSRTNTIPHGSICVKVGFVQPPNSTSHPDLRNTYDVLAIPGLTNPVTPMLGIGSSKNPSFPDEAPVVILRVQILSCHNLEAKNRSGYSDPCAHLLIILQALLSHPHVLFAHEVS